MLQWAPGFPSPMGDVPHVSTCTSVAEGESQRRTWMTDPDARSRMHDLTNVPEVLLDDANRR